MFLFFPFLSINFSLYSFSPLVFQYCTLALPNEGIWGSEVPCFFHDGDWAQSHPDMMEILGKLEALGQPNLCKHFIKLVPDCDLGSIKINLPQCDSSPQLAESQA